MRYTEDLARLKAEANEQLIRKIVREEIVRALGALQREADHLDMPYETAELDSRALTNIAQAAEGAVQRLMCPHEQFYAWGDQSRCSKCGEPETMPENPFKEGRTDGPR